MDKILGAFLLISDYRILTNEELKDVQEAIKKIQEQKNNLMNIACNKIIKDYDIETPLKEECNSLRLKVIALEEFNNILQQEIEELKEQISKAIDYCTVEREDINGGKCDDILKILESGE